MIAKALVKSAIPMCEECQSTDPALIQREKGKLEGKRNWQRLGMDIPHYSACHFLMFTDCGPLHFSIWKQLARQDSASMFVSQRQCSLSVAHCMKSLWTMTQPASAKSPKLLHMSGEFLYDSIGICPSWEWHSRVMSQHGETNCSQDALSHTGGCLLV